MKYCCRYSSCIGNLFLISDGTYLLELKINEKPTYDLVEKEDLEIFKKTKKWLDDYFKGTEPKEKIPFKMEGTDFQREVWNLLLEIPYGQVVTYGSLASKIAKKRNIPKMSSQAIGNAVHNNPIPMLVPCHRVVGKGKNLVGYALGMDLKIQLLKTEGMDLKGYYFYENKEKNVVQ